MAFTRKSKRTAYDNIASGSVTGVENIIATGTGGEIGETSRLTVEVRTVQAPEFLWTGSGSNSETSRTSKFMENVAAGASTS